jgi:hypothetical protein
MNLKSPENPDSQHLPPQPQKAVWPRFVLVGMGCVALLVILSVWMLGSFFFSPEREARSRLDGLLGQGQSGPQFMGPESISPESLAPESDPFSDLPEPNLPPEANSQVPDARLGEDLNNSLNEMLSQLPDIPNKQASQGGVSVKDTSEAIVIEVPVKDQQAAQKIEVKASPNWVQVSGQAEVSLPGVGGKSISTFMRSFSSSDTLLPEKMTRKVFMDKTTGQNKLVVRIPKAAGQKDSGSGQSGSHSEEKKPMPDIEGGPSNMPVDGYI